MPVPAEKTAQTKKKEKSIKMMMLAGDRAI